MPCTIRTPFLRLFIRFFGYSSLQLLPIQLNHLPSLLNFFWNLLLVGLVTFERTILQSVWLASNLADPRVVAALAEKPLFALIYRLSYGFFYQVAFGINLLYFCAINLPAYRPSLIRLLDAFRPDLFTCPQKSKRFFIRVYILLQVGYFVTMAEMVIVLAVKSLYFEMAAFYIVFFALNLNANMPFYLTFYYKVATSVRLKEITESYRQNLDQNSIRFVEQEVARLATLNSELGRLLSLPLLIALFPYLSEILIFISLLSIKGFNELNFYMVQFVWQAVYLAILERRIGRQIKDLSALIKTKYEQQKRNCKQNTSQNFVYLQLPKQQISKSSSSNEDLLPPSIAFTTIALEKIYAYQMRLRLFDDLATIDWAFFSNLFLLLLNLIALMVQTTPMVAENTKSAQ